ncbi:MAG TPA: type II toxin-antitoxin system VapC family toxin [Candidatus Acidoferrales bacterium]|nr:type II toxin-antitoxin system VapC family toxin [Candidatus Acidoferrales bacterium]
MIVDTSAIVAILRGEPDADRYIEALSLVAEPLISAGTYLETAIVIDSNRDPVLSGRLDDLLATARVKVEPVTERHAEIARQAYRDFGKGSGHSAGLNLGDCFAYALARASGEPLLFKGDDFTKTDVVSARDHSTHSR